MSADTKSIKNRIKSVESTLHITKAMQLVASSKIRRATIAYQTSLDFANTFRSAYSSLISSENRSSPFMAERPELPCCYVIIAADRGLAGGYNGNIFRYASTIVTQHDYVVPIGKRAVDHCRKKYASLISTELTSSEKITDSEISELADTLINMYIDGTFGKISVISTEFTSIISQDVRLEQLLPLSFNGIADIGYTLYEPDPVTVLNYAIKSYLTSLLCAHIRESYLSELYSRRNAMDSATENAEEIIEELSLKSNRARQSNITQEIAEIVAGAEDL